MTSLLVALTHLVLVGGGSRPPAALQRFVQWAGGSQARILVITWATSEPDASFQSLRDDFLPHGPASVENASGVLDDRLERSTGVFFSGGDQNRIMQLLDANPGLLARLRAMYLRGTPFGGTSAGTAAISELMITGDEFQLRSGLGLLPGAILDTHFVVRSRQNRLFEMVLAHPDKLGIGIDEGTALLVEGGTQAEVVGPSEVMTVRATGPGSLSVHIAKDGERFEL